MIDIVTVVFGPELPVLSCQAQSIEIYCKEIGAKNIFVMVNEPDLAAKIDPDWYGSESQKVRVVPRETFTVEWGQNGWVNQQLLKLLATTLSKNSWSMILDAKTILTNNLYQDQLLTAQGQMRLGWMPVAPVFYPAQAIANAIFDCHNEQTLQPGGVPFFFHNQSIRSMMDFVERKTHQDFAHWFLSQGRLTEFVLYSTWIHMDPYRKNLYTDSDQATTLAICHVCHTHADQFDRILSAHDDRTHTISVHRQAWAGLSASQKEVFRKRLLARGITRAAHLQ